MILMNAEPSIPELSNIFTLLHLHFEGSFWASALQHWQYLCFSVFAAVFISGLFYFAAQKKKSVPEGIQNFCEWLVEIMRQLVVEVMGPEGEKYLPFLATIFVYILTMNLIGLIPLMKPPTSSLNITIALAVCVFAVVQFLQFRNRGLLGYLYHLAGHPHNFAGWILSPLIFAIDLIGQFTRPLTLAFRLFGNVFGEDILIGYFTLLGMAALSAYFVVGLPLQLPFMLFSFFVSILQALVFTLLSAIYIMLTFPHAEEEEADEH